MVETIYIDKNNSRLEQGDLIEGFTYVIPQTTSEEVILDEITFPYAVIVTQDCELEQDFNNRANVSENNDKFIKTVTLLPAYNAQQVKEGKHLESSFGFKMQNLPTDLWKPVKSNNSERYHFLHQNLENSIPDLVIDFKHPYTVSRDELYKAVQKNTSMVRLTIGTLFREDLTRRYANFISRIAVPTVKRPSAPATV